MSIAYWTVLAMIFMPFVLAGMSKSAGGYDNAQPREWLARLSGWQQRAYWAELNTFEAFPAFAAAVIIAHQLEAHQVGIDALALGFFALRVGYAGAYVANRPGWRSWLWIGGFICVVGLFVLAALTGV